MAKQWILEEFKVAEPTDVLLSVRAPVGELNITLERCVIGRGLAAIRGRSADPRFIYYLLHERRRLLDSLGQGSTFEAINGTDLRGLPVLLPPLPEQQKIAAILSSVDEAIQATQAVIDQTRRVKEGLLQDLLTRGLPGHTRFKQTEIGEIPEGWEVRTLGSLIVGNPANGLSPKEAESGVPTFSIAAVRDGRIDINGNLKYADVDRETSRHFRVKRGDILLVRGNANPAYVGSAGVVLDYPEDCIYPDILMRLVPGDQVDSTFLLLAINAPFVHDQLLQKAKSTNGTLKVNGQDVRATKLPIPSLMEQHSIVKRIMSASDAGSAATLGLASLNALKSGLLADLLTGKVRVTP